jgi:hypothetical protein
VENRMWRIRKRKKFRTNLGEVTFTAPPFSVHLRRIYLEICVYIGCHPIFPGVKLLWDGFLDVTVPPAFKFRLC